ncbi:MAG: phosphoribosyl 1,2-cyclic phosphate phosphodiesterase [Crocinitomicaceae bacterium]|jgi:phosphoribosyl 1,2-cyclic phosphate phosphodiesterase
MKITVLGSGTSQGIPVIACECEVCQSDDPKDSRLRSSILVEYKGTNYAVDSGPDFRQQMLQNKVKTLSGIIFTHEHKDHVAGLDDVRAFNYKEGRDMDLYCDERVEAKLKIEFAYAFTEHKHGGVPKLNLIPITNEPFELENGLKVIPIEVMHFRLPVLGFRFGDFTYITDAKTIAPAELDKVRGTKVLIVNALRKEEHISHLNLEEALAFIDEVKPERAYLTHISHLFGRHDDIQKLLPANVFPAYDGMTIEFND